MISVFEHFNDFDRLIIAIISHSLWNCEFKMFHGLIKLHLLPVYGGIPVNPVRVEKKNVHDEVQKIKKHVAEKWHQR